MPLPLPAVSVALTVAASTLLLPLTTAPTSAASLPEAGQVATDSFSRSVPAGLGGADVGGSWSVSGSGADFSVANGTARVQQSSPGRGASARLGSALSTDTDLTTTLSLARAATGGGSYLSVLGRSVAGAGDYRLKVWLAGDQSLRVSLGRTVGSSEAALSPATTVTPRYVAGTPVHVRLRVRGTGTTTVLGTAWTGDTEPASWTLRGTDTTPALQTPGTPGLVSYLSGSATTSQTVTVDDLSVTTPTTTLLDPASTVPVRPGGPGVSFAANTPGSRFECRLDTSAWTTCASPVSYPGLTDGDHTFTVRAVDTEGFAAAPASRSWAVDSTPPTVTLTGRPAAGSLTSSGSAALAVATSEPATLECRLDEGPWTGCGVDPSWGGLPDGSHVAAVRATDAAGNTGPEAAHAWTVDTTAPDTAVSATPAPEATATRSAMAVVLTGSEPGSSFECALDGASWSACTSPLSLRGLALGTHTLAARATDAAGNVDPSPASASWTTVAPAPVAPAPVTPAPATPVPAAGTLLRSTFDALPTGPVSLGDFRTAMGTTTGGGASTVARTSVVAAAGHGNVLRQHFIAGQVGGGAGIVFMPSLTKATDDATIDYDVRFAGAFDWGWGGKLPGLGGVNSLVSPGTPTGGNGPTDNGWSGRMMWNTPSSYRSHLGPNEFLAYPYHPGQADSYGDNLWSGSTLTPDAWHHVTARYAMNTITNGVGNRDGVLRVWLDGKLVVNRSDFVFRNRSDVHVSHLYWDLFYGGATTSWAPKVDTDIDTDNLVVTDNS